MMLALQLFFIFFCYLPLLFTVKPETIKTSQRRIGLFSVMAFVVVPADIVHCNQRFFVQLSMTRYSMIMRVILFIVAYGYIDLTIHKES